MYAGPSDPCSPTDPRLVKRVEELLDACDLVKFANSPAGDEETDQMLASALTMVRETRPLVGASPMPGELVAQAAIPIPDTRVGPSRFRGPVPKPVPDPNVTPARAEAHRGGRHPGDARG